MSPHVPFRTEFSQLRTRPCRAASVRLFYLAPESGGSNEREQWAKCARYINKTNGSDNSRTKTQCVYIVNRFLLYTHPHTLVTDTASQSNVVEHTRRYFIYLLHPVAVLRMKIINAAPHIGTSREKLRVRQRHIVFGNLILPPVLLSITS